MKVIFIANYMNHHQKYLCDELYRITDGDFNFIATEKMNSERKGMGWKVLEADYVIEATPDNEGELMDRINAADVVITGGLNHKYLKKRHQNGKLTFLYSERIYKVKPSVLKVFYHRLKFFFTAKRYKNFYLLAASAYAPADYARIGCFKGKAYKWGYFPETKYYEDVKDLITRKQSNLELKHPGVSILWVARLIGWKHPEATVVVAKTLKEDGYKFLLNVIGNGEKEDELRQMIKDNNLEDCVHLLGSMTPEDVRENMEKSDIFLFSSDRNEGWGAVLNEAMNSACACVACETIGSVCNMLKDKINGLIFNELDWGGASDAIKFLIDNPRYRKQMQLEAYKTIITNWSARNAAESLVKLSEDLLAGKKTSIVNGPCSKSEIIE